MKIMLARALALIALPLSAAVQMKTPSDIMRVPNPDRPGTAWAVRAKDAPLLMTAQVLPADVTRDARGQMEDVVNQLAAILARSQGDLNRVLRLNVYISSEAATSAVDAVLAARFADAPPAVTLMYTPLSRSGALVACDAVAVVSTPASTVQIRDGVAVVPAGG